MAELEPVPWTAEPFLPPPAQRTLETLRAAAGGCRGCPLFAPATQTVFGLGEPGARLMLVGEQPGDQEDRKGTPFVGPAGGVLAKALEAADLPRAWVYVTNAVKHFKYRDERKTKRRLHDKPTVAETKACRPWLEAEIDLLHPAGIVCLGATAGRAVLQRTVKIGAERGRLIPSPWDAWLLVTTHPAAILRARERREAAFAELVADLKQARAALDRG